MMLRPASSQWRCLTSARGRVSTSWANDLIFCLVIYIELLEQIKYDEKTEAVVSPRRWSFCLSTWASGLRNFYVRHVPH